MKQNELQKLLDEHNSPPETPRERMYLRIRKARQERTGRRRWWPMAAALAALLVLGVGLGRLSQDPAMPTAGTSPVPEPQSEAGSGLLYRETTQRLFAGADALLTDFRLEGCRAERLPATTVWARSMLMQTRVLQGTPAGRDPELAGLLGELELTLTQIVTIDPEQCDRDADWIRHGLDERDTLGRLRTVASRTADTDPL